MAEDDHRDGKNAQRVDAEVTVSGVHEWKHNSTRGKNTPGAAWNLVNAGV